MKNFYSFLLVFLFLGIIQSKAQYTELHNFNDTLGEIPDGALTLSGNRFFGMTWGGGMHGDGLIFSIDTNGKNYKDLYDFNGTKGSNPCGSLTLLGNKLYGMTLAGGAHSSGCIFSIDTNGTGYNELFDFGGTTGSGPRGSLIYASGKLFGMTSGLPGGNGNIFSIDTNGFKDLYDFHLTDGASPFGSLTLLGNRVFGMTSRGTGVFANGWIFSIDTNGTGFKDLMAFNKTSYPQGSMPEGSLTLIGNKLFGMTYYGGLNDSGCVFSLDTSGLGYKDLLDFNGTNGSIPWGDLIFIGDKLYGKATRGGLNGYGCLFSIDTSGSGYNDMYDFNNTSGAYPDGGPLLHSGNDLYGMTQGGGTFGIGVIFKFGQLGLGIDNANVPMQKITVFPNPSSGIFTIQLSVGSGQSSVDIYNVMGERLLTEILRSAQDDKVIDLSKQPNGVYLYRVVSDMGELIGSGKIIKE